MKRLPAVHAFWQARTVRERRVLLVGAGVLALLLGWFLLVAPALQARERLQRELPALRAALAQVQSLSGEFERLGSGNTTPPPLNRAVLERTLQERGLRAQGLVLTDTQVKLTVSDVSFTALAESLQQLQRSQRLAVTEVSMTARERPDRVDATLVLQRP